MHFKTVALTTCTFLSLAKSQQIDGSCCKVLQGTNNYRAQQGRGALQGDTRLDLAAQLQCQAMAARNAFGHSVDGTQVSDRVQRAGLDFRGVAENIYEESGRNDENPSRPVKGWIESPGHAKNMRGDFTRMGAAFCGGRNGQTYWVQVFGRGDEKSAFTYSTGSCGSQQSKSQQGVYGNFPSVDGGRRQQVADTNVNRSGTRYRTTANTRQATTTRTPQRKASPPVQNTNNNNQTPKTATQGKKIGEKYIPSYGGGASSADANSTATAGSDVANTVGDTANAGDDNAGIDNNNGDVSLAHASLSAGVINSVPSLLVLASVILVL